MRHLCSLLLSAIFCTRQCAIQLVSATRRASRAGAIAGAARASNKRGRVACVGLRKSAESFGKGVSTSLCLKTQGQQCQRPKRAGRHHGPGRRPAIDAAPATLADNAAAAIAATAAARPLPQRRCLSRRRTAAPPQPSPAPQPTHATAPPDRGTAAAMQAVAPATPRLPRRS